MPKIQSPIRRSLFGAFSAAAAALSAPLVLAQQAYPARPIRLVIPFAVGGSTDIVGRLVGQKLGDALGAAVVPDNRPGANGTLGVDIVAKSTPDGYALVLADIGGFSMAPSLYPRLPYNPLRDFEVISLVGRSPLVLTVGANSPAHSLKDLIAMAQTQPGKLNYPSSGAGGPNHLAAELFNIQAHVKTTHIPYKGSAPSVVSLVSGETDFGFLTAVTIHAQLKAGKVRALAVASTKRLESMPDVPTMAEAGLAPFEAEAWFMAAAPAGTPRPIIDKLQRTLHQVLTLPEVRRDLANTGVDAVGNSPEAARAFLESQIAQWANVVKTADIRLERS